MALVNAVRGVLQRPWFGHAALLGICVAVLLVAALASPSTEVLTLFGQPIPVLCTWRRLTGWACPGCGLTRSFVFLAHGEIVQAFQMNPFGPVAFAWISAQIPWRAAKLWQAGQRKSPQGP